MRIMILVLALCLTGCSAESAWIGNYNGQVSESSQINHLVGDTSSSDSGARSSQGIGVSVAKSGDKELLVTTERGQVKLKISSAHNAEVIQGQHWHVALDGYDGDVLLVGSANLEGSNRLMLQLTGTAQERDYSGGYAYTFSGERAK